MSTSPTSLYRRVAVLEAEGKADKPPVIFVPPSPAGLMSLRSVALAMSICGAPIARTSRRLPGVRFRLLPPLPREIE
jgi:hypothetical protein